MKLIRNGFIAAAFALATVGAASAATITFEEFGITNNGAAGGEVTGNEWAALGVVFSTPDLELNIGGTTGSQPNSLGADANGPNDFSGQIDIQFTGGLSYTDVTFTIFNTPFQAQAFDLVGNLLSTLSSADGEFSQLFDFSGFAVNSISVTGTFYAIDDLQFSTVASPSAIPIPAGFPLLISGLALLGLAGVRRRKSRS